MRSRSLLFALAVAAMAPSAQATILTFNGMTLSNGDPMLQTYGDNVASSGSAASGLGTYAMGNGWTPNVTTSYYQVDVNGRQTSPNVKFWTTDYGDMTNVVYADDYLRVRLAPEAGFSVKVVSFWLAGWPKADQTATRIRVINDFGTELWSSTKFAIKGATTHSAFLPGIESTEALTVEYGGGSVIGFDQLSFSQAPVPEPTTVVALAIGGLALLRRKRQD